MLGRRQSANEMPVPRRHHLCAVFALLLSLALSPTASAARVVVFGLAPRGIDAATVKQGTDSMLQTLRGLSGVQVIDPKTGKARLGVDLVEQARACEYDVFCLVEVGELLEGQQILIGHLSRLAPTDSHADEGLELKLMVLDIAKATTTEVLLWRVPDLDPQALRDATRAATRRLFAPRDLQVQFNLTPENAKLRLYGEPLGVVSGQPMPYWSGHYHATMTADGYHPQQIPLKLEPQQGVLQVGIELKEDPLWVAGKAGSARPFERTSRSMGSGASAQTVGAVVTQPEAEYAYQGPLPWVAAGTGLALSVLGGVLMQRAQGSYNSRAEERRYTPTVTVTADVAMRDRDRAASAYRAGSGVMFAGMAVVVGAGLWMIIDAALSKPAAEVDSQLSLPPDAASRRAAHRLAMELTP